MKSHLALSFCLQITTMEIQDGQINFLTMLWTISTFSLNDVIINIYFKQIIPTKRKVCKVINIWVVYKIYNTHPKVTNHQWIFQINLRFTFYIKMKSFDKQSENFRLSLQIILLGCLDMLWVYVMHSWNIRSPCQDLFSLAVFKCFFISFIFMITNSETETS